MKLNTAQLTEKQLDRLSEIIGNLGIVFFSTVAAPLFSGKVDESSVFVVALGLILSVGCTLVSLLIMKEIK